MKSNQAMIGTALLFLVLAVATSATLWGEVTSAVKIGMFGFGFGAGVAAGASLARRRI